MKLKFIQLVMLVVSINYFSIKSQAQDLDFTDVLSAGVEDASLYLENYIDPFMKGFGFGMTNGWYNTAKPHKLLGLDLTVTANLAYVPNKDLFFDFENFNSLTING